MQFEEEIAPPQELAAVQAPMVQAPKPPARQAQAPGARAPKAKSKPDKQDKPDNKPKLRVEFEQKTLLELVEGYLGSLESSGKSAGTVASYTMELKTAMAELGEETRLQSLTSEQVEAYFNSRKVTRLKSGKSKAKPSIDKTRRVLRLALVWGVQAGWIKKAPLPEAQAVPA